MGNVKPKYDLTGQRFGRLYVQEYSGRGLWICKCDCGKTREILTTRLIHGIVRSCGCKGKVDHKSDKLKPYVYEMLMLHGNTVISESVYTRLGEKTILNDLKKHGFDCYIRIAKHNDKFNPWSSDLLCIIIELKR